MGPYTETNINRLERIQRQAARFITGDYRSRECLQHACETRSTRTQRDKNEPETYILAQILNQMIT